MLPLLLSLALLAADPPPPIRLPAVTVAADPKPVPGPDAVTKLTPDRLYVLDSDVPVVVLTSPAGLATLTEDAGPLRIRGVFADGTGKPETRTFAGKYVYTLEATHSGRVELIVVPVGAKAAGEVLRRTIEVVAGGKPPIVVNPDPVKPDPKPPAAVKLKAVVVYESEDASLAADAFYSDKPLAERWKLKGHLPPVTVDVNVKDPLTEATPARLAPYVNRAAGKALPQLYLVDAATGAVLYEGPRPTTPAAMTQVLDSIGG